MSNPTERLAAALADRYCRERNSARAAWPTFASSASPVFQSHVASSRHDAQLPDMMLTALAPLDVSPEVAERQAQRYRQMTPAEKLARADAIWDLAWDAVTSGVRLRDPDLDDASVTRTARELFRRAAD